MRVPSNYLDKIFGGMAFWITQQTAKHDDELTVRATAATNLSYGQQSATPLPDSPKISQPRQPCPGSGDRRMYGPKTS
jgi:hypothetical protein